MNADNVNKWLTLSANIGVVIGLILLLVELDLLIWHYNFIVIIQLVIAQNALKSVLIVDRTIFYNLRKYT